MVPDNNAWGANNASSTDISPAHNNTAHNNTPANALGTDISLGFRIWVLRV